MIKRNFEDLYNPEFHDPLKEVRLLTKLSSFITEENFNPSLYSYLENLIKTYQIHFTEINESETIEDKRDRLYIESTKLSLVAFITDSLLRFQFEFNTQSDNSKIDDEEIMKAANIIVTLLDLKPGLKKSTVNALATIIKERNYLYHLKDNKDFLIKILNDRFENDKNIRDGQKQLGIVIKTSLLRKDITSLSPNELEKVLSTCTMGQTHLGLKLICPQEIFQNYIGEEGVVGIKMSIDFNGHKNKVICVSEVSEPDDQNSTIEHENLHVIYSYILDEKELSTALDSSTEVLKDIQSDLIGNEVIDTENLKLEMVKKIKSLFLNELFAQTLHLNEASILLKESDQIKESYDKTVFKEVLNLYKLYLLDLFLLKKFRTHYFPMYLFNFDILVQTNQKYYSDEKNLQELMDLKAKIVAEWESIIGRTFDLIMKYNNLKELISFTISISDSDDINKNLNRLEVFLKKYSKN